jgi:hypothetical protein
MYRFNLEKHKLYSSIKLLSFISINKPKQNAPHLFSSQNRRIDKIVVGYDADMKENLKGCNEYQFCIDQLCKYEFRGKYE